MNDTRFLRNKDLINQDNLDKLTIIGLGGIGSNLCHLASTMGFKEFLLYDADLFEPHNRSSSLYPTKMLYKPKVECAKDIIKSYAPDTHVICNEAYWTEENELGDKVFIATDNMEIRKLIYENWIKIPHKNNSFLIDLRMSALTMEVVTVTSKSDNYLKHWVSSDEVADDPCTMKYTIFNTSVVAGLGLTQAYQVMENKSYFAYLWVNLVPFNVNYIERIKGNC